MTVRKHRVALNKIGFKFIFGCAVPLLLNKLSLAAGRRGYSCWGAWASAVAARGLIS